MIALALMLAALIGPPPSPDYAAAAKYARERGGQALLIMVGADVVLEDTRSSPERFAQTIMSGTKTFACGLAALAIGDGALRLDERVVATLPELKRPEGAPGKGYAEAITVRDLLTQTSGLKGGGTSTSGDHRAWIRSHARLLTIAAPGTSFSYGAAHWDLFEALMQAKLGADPIDVLDTRLLTPLGIEQRAWKRDGADQRFLAFGLVTTPRSWARLGRLMNDDGVFEGRRLLPAGTTAECLRGSNANPGYGIGWWLNQPMPPAVKRSAGFPTTLRNLTTDGVRRAILPDGPSDLAMAAGSSDTRLYIVPSRALVIVRFGWKDNARWSDADFLRPILLPAAR